MIKKSVKILVGYHKPSVLVKSDILIPMHLGRALSTEASKDGKMSQDDYQWMLDNMIGDDTGDNISHLNREFCELTAIYWAWKNYDKLGNPDYIGFMHYRRFWGTNLKEDTTIKTIYQIQEDIVNSVEQIRQQLETVELILPYPHDIRDLKFDNIIKQYNGYSYHYKNGLNLLKDILYQKNKILYDCFDEYFNDYSAYFSNMFIMSKNDFIKYCQTIFDILFTIRKQLKFTNSNIMEKRAIAYLGEYLTGLYLFYLSNITKHKKCHRYMVQNTNISVELKPAFNKNNVAVFCSTDNNYLPYCAVLLKSIISNGKNTNNYDIVILEEQLSDESKYKIQTLAQHYTNVSIRFYNISHLIANKKLHLSAHFTIAAYYRLFVSSIFKNYNKIVYLDIDTICLTDIEKLFRIDLQEYLLAACQDYGVIAKLKGKKGEPIEYFQKNVGCKNPFTEYLQSGVVLFNITELIKQNTEESLINTAINNKFNYIDQDVLNKVCHGKVLFLDSSWNVQVESGTKKGIMSLLPIKLYHKWLEDRKNPKIIHYASYCKPWNVPSSDLADIWWRYARQTPFYEEILYKNLKSNYIQDIKQQISKTLNASFVKDIANYSKNRFNYYRCRLLANVTFGKMRKHYKNKKKELKAKIKAVRRFLKS